MKLLKQNKHGAIIDPTSNDTLFVKGVALPMGTNKEADSNSEKIVSRWNFVEQLLNIDYDQYYITYDDCVVESGEWLVCTTHPKITYDDCVETFNVDLGDGSWCEVYGMNRFKKAIMIAEFMRLLEEVE